MHASARLSLPVAFSALVLGTASVASAQGASTGGNPGQFGGSAPGQFDPNAQPGAAQPGAASPPNGAAPGPSPFGSMNAGGLAPPPPLPPGSGPPSYDASTDPNPLLDRSKDEDSGRGLSWFWLEAGGGFEHVALGAIDTTELTSSCTGVACKRLDVLTPTTGTGPMVDAGLGVRLVFFTVGARTRVGFFEDFDLVRIGGEVGLRVPLGSIEPRIQAGVGYAAELFESAPASGYFARVGGGLDYFVVSNLALGGDVSGEIVGLSRETPSAGGKLATDFVSSSVGLGVTLGVHVGLHL